MPTLASFSWNELISRLRSVKLAVMPGFPGTITAVSDESLVNEVDNVAMLIYSKITIRQDNLCGDGIAIQTSYVQLSSSFSQLTRAPRIWG